MTRNADSLTRTRPVAPRFTVEEGIIVRGIDRPLGVRCIVEWRKDDTGSVTAVFWTGLPSDAQVMADALNARYGDKENS